MKLLPEHIEYVGWLKSEGFGWEDVCVLCRRAGIPLTRYEIISMWFAGCTTALRFDRGGSRRRAVNGFCHAEQDRFD